MLKIKICGIKTIEIAETAVGAGANALGFVFYEESPRFISPGKAAEIIKVLPPFVSKVGVFVDKTLKEIVKIIEKTGLDTIQLHGEASLYNKAFLSKLRKYTGLPVIYAVRLSLLENRAIDSLKEEFDEKLFNAYLLDTFHTDEYGGTGKLMEIRTLDDELKDFIRKKIILAGGLNAWNIKVVLEKIMPYGIDVSSGVERVKGEKDKILIREFMNSALETLRKHSLPDRVEG